MKRREFIAGLATIGLWGRAVVRGAIFPRARS
jgi:hypothetical protein